MGLLVTMYKCTKYNITRSLFMFKEPSLENLLTEHNLDAKLK